MEFEERVVFSILGLPVTGYAICVAAAAAAGLLLFFFQGKREKLGSELAWRTALLALPLGLIGARAFYCLARLPLYMEIGLDAALRLWEGGFALWGAVGGAALAGLIAARSAGRPCAPVLDALAAPGALAIALSRFGEYFSGEGCGLYVESEAFQRFPFAVFDGYYEEWKWAVFMLEGLAALAIMAALLRSGRKKPGDRARLLLILYGACQITLESLRRDSYLRWLFVKVSQLTGAVVIALLMGAATIRWLRARENRRLGGGGLALCWGGFSLCVGLCVALEFAADDKIWHALPVWAIYGLMACCSLGILLSARGVVFGGLQDDAKEKLSR